MEGSSSLNNPGSNYKKNDEGELRILTHLFIFHFMFHLMMCEFRCGNFPTLLPLSRFFHPQKRMIQSQFDKRWEHFSNHLIQYWFHQFMYDELHLWCRSKIYHRKILYLSHAAFLSLQSEMITSKSRQCSLGGVRCVRGAILYYRAPSIVWIWSGNS